jgi:tetratricopeptide (TPR) repeat protein
MGIKLQAWNINALANRGEILFNQGRLTEALADFQKVLYYDPEDANPSTLRTKALLLAIKESVEAKAKEAEESGEGEG